MVIPARPHSVVAVALMRNYESTNWGLTVLYIFARVMFTLFMTIQVILKFGNTASF